MLVKRAARNSLGRWVCPDCATVSRDVLQHRISRRSSHWTSDATPQPSRLQRSIKYAQKRFITTLPPQSIANTSTPNSWPVHAVPTPRPAESINSPSPIPISTQGLHSALRQLELRAANFLSLARVKLAISSVATGLGGTTRIALLALTPDGKEGVKRLVKVLLADVLGKERDWERQLLEQGDGRSVLVKYGQDGEQDYWNRMMKTIYVDSPLLKHHGVEFLISTMNVQVGGATTSAAATERSVLDTFLVPMAEMAATEAGGGLSVLSWPVHKTLLVAEALRDLVELGRFEAGIGGSVATAPELVKVVVDGSSVTGEESSAVLAVDAASAERGIDAFRSDLSKSLDYEHAWFKSGIPLVSNWIFDNDSTGANLKRDIKVFINALISDTSVRIEAAERALNAQIQASDSAMTNTGENLVRSANEWQRRAHSDLQNTLESAFHSTSWKKLAWWRLLWRVDDVGMIGHDVLRTQFLVNPEKELIYLFGRIREAGLLNGNDALQFAAPQEPPEAVIESSTEKEIKSNPSPLSETIATLYPPILPPLAPAPEPTPYPTQIYSARSSLTKSLLTLQSKAQTLLLTCLSTASLGGAVAALVQISSPLTTFYESGAIAAFGLAIAAVRLQTGWDKERGDFEADARETGRSALIQTGGIVNKVVLHGDQGSGRDVDVGLERQQIHEAKKAVQDVKDALSRMGEK